MRTLSFLIRKAVDLRRLDRSQELGLVLLIAYRKTQAVFHPSLQVAYKDAINALTLMSGRKKRPIVSFHIHLRLRDDLLVT